MVPRARETFLKLLLALGLLLVPAIARADELLVGALRDQDGAAVAGATVTALDAHGAVLARDRSAADGTFALATPVRATTVLIAAAYSDPLRVAVPAGGAPVVAVVRRHRSADLVPSAADVAALPAGTLGAVAEVAPYRIAFPGSVSDRWLNFGRGVTTVEGLPFYRVGDGADATSLLPAHAFGAIGVTDPLAAPWYGDRAGGGIVDARLFDRADAQRVTDRDAALAFGNDPAGLLATSWDADGERQLVAARGSGDLGPLHATAVALAGNAPGTNYAGAGLQLRTATQRTDLAARFDLTASDAAALAGTADSGSVAGAILDASGRGPDAVALRLRWRDERGVLGDEASEHRDGALVLGTTRGSAVRVTAAVALDYGADVPYQAQASSGFAVLPSLTADAALGNGLTLHGGFGDSTLGTPGVALARSSLGELGLAYDDRHRLRAEVLAYAQGDAVPVGLNRGLGFSLGWEIAPRLSLRAWSLRDVEGFDGTAPLYPGGPLQTVVSSSRFDRDLVWLSWDADARFDLLVREGALEGNVRIPVAVRYALTLGSYRRPNGTRTFSAGVVRR
ncbi:MAG TPA: hypothetical protein VHT53_07840 [Candidatus Elarobacter sp.]|nr:hypothetical protein [Candidatus Elarobacter sp.]